MMAEKSNESTTGENTDSPATSEDIALFEIRAHLGMITAQITHISRFVQSVRDWLELIMWATVGALLGYAVAKILLAIMNGG